MSLSINCNFCESARFRCRRCTNWCCPNFCGGRADSDDEDEPKAAMVMVTGQGPQQFGLFPTQFLDLKEWLPGDDAEHSTLTLFRRHPVDAPALQILLHHEPHDPTTRVTMLAAAADEKAAPHGCEVLLGRRATDVLAPHLTQPLERFMLDTLDGVYFQLHASFNMTNRIIQTFPVHDSLGQVVAGIMTVSPYNWANADLKEYAMPVGGGSHDSLGHMGRRSLKRSHRRPKTGSGGSK